MVDTRQSRGYTIAMSDNTLVPRKTQPQNGLMTRLAEVSEAGADDLVVETLGKMLETGARPSAVAQQSGLSTDALWMLINTNPNLYDCMKTGTRLRQLQTAEVVRERLERVVKEMANMVEDVELPGPARVQAGKEFWNMAKDLGVVEAHQSDGKSGGVAVMDGEFQGRLTVLLGGDGG